MKHIWICQEDVTILQERVAISLGCVPIEGANSQRWAYLGIVKRTFCFKTRFDLHFTSKKSPYEKGPNTKTKRRTYA